MQRESLDLRGVFAPQRTAVPERKGLLEKMLNIFHILFDSV